MNELYQSITPYKQLPFQLIVFDKNTDVDLHCYPKHWHEYLELNITIHGTGKNWIDGQEYKIKDHNVFIINPYAIHQTIGYPPYDQIKGYCLQIDLSYFQTLFPELNNQFHATCDESLSNRIINEVTILDQMIKKNVDSFEIYIQIVKILKILAKNTISKTLETDKYKHRMLSISKYILAHYNEPLNVDELSKHFELSKSHLHKLFKDYFHQSIHQYITEIRMVHAIDDLKYSDLSILELSLNNGFSSNKSFINEFKKRYQITPSLYRQQINKRK